MVIMISISASLMCANWLRLEDEIKTLEKAGTDAFHLDIMDGSFVPNFAINFWQVSAIRNSTRLPLEVHMMVHEPMRYIHRLCESKVNRILIHTEGCADLDHTLHEIKDHGVEAGVAFNVETPITPILDCLDSIDVVLFMATRPGFMGQKFRPEVVPKLSSFIKIAKDNGLHPHVVGDGHISKDTIPLLAKEGMDTFVGGTTSLFNTEGSYKEKIRTMRELAEKYYCW